MVGVPMPTVVVPVELIEPVAGTDMPPVELIEPVAGIDVPPEELMPVPVDVGLELAGIDVPAGLAGVDVEIVCVGAGVNPTEKPHPAGTCETLIGEMSVSVGAERPCIIEAGFIVTVVADLADALTDAGRSVPLMTTFMGAPVCVPCCALASAVKSLRRAATLNPLCSSWTIRVNWAPVGFV
jgi:hypothetical protein